MHNKLTVYLQSQLLQLKMYNEINDGEWNSKHSILQSRQNMTLPQVAKGLLQMNNVWENITCTYSYLVFCINGLRKHNSSYATMQLYYWAEVFQFEWRKDIHPYREHEQLWHDWTVRKVWHSSRKLQHLMLFTDRRTLDMKDKPYNNNSLTFHLFNETVLKLSCLKWRT